MRISQCRSSPSITKDNLIRRLTPFQFRMRLAYMDRIRSNRRSVVVISAEQRLNRSGTGSLSHKRYHTSAYRSEIGIVAADLDVRCAVKAGCITECRSCEGLTYFQRKGALAPCQLGICTVVDTLVELNRLLTNSRIIAETHLITCIIKADAALREQDLCPIILITNGSRIRIIAEFQCRFTSVIINIFAIVIVATDLNRISSGN